MNFETLFLRGLFGVCVLICGLTLVAMITATPVRATAGHAVATTVTSTAPVRAAG